MSHKNPISGIYQIKNLVSGKTYIGSSNIIQVRWSQHRKDLRSGVHFNPKLQNAWNKHGEDSFEFSIVEVCDMTNLREREQFYISSMSPFYNIADIVGMPYTPKAGTLEAKQRSIKGQPKRIKTLNTPECQERLSKANKEVWTREGHRETRSSETLELWNNAEYRMKQKLAHRKVQESDREFIRKSRAERTLSCKSLAQMFDVSLGTITRILQGQH